MDKLLLIGQAGSFFRGTIRRKQLAVLLGLAGALSLATPAHAASALYAASAAGAAGELYIIDPANGAMIQDVGPLNDSSAQNYPMTGLAFHPFTGVLYGSTGNSVPASAAKLVTINPGTGLVTPVGPFNVGNVGTPATMADIEFDPNTGILYGIGSVGGPQLYSINLATGQATVIGSTGLTSTSGGGLAISSSGVFYGSPTPSRYGTYDLGTGAFSLITNPDKPAGTGAYGALSYNENGVLYGLNVGPGSPPPTHIVTIDPPTGAVTDLGASLNSLDSFAFQIPTRPILSIAKTGSQVSLTWLDLPGYLLLYGTNVATGTWRTNTTPPTTLNGTNTLTLTPSSRTNTFYRLFKP